MNFIMKLFGTPLGYIMWGIYKLIPNYLVALVLFTVITKVLLLPLAIKQQKGTIKMQIMQPKITEIQNKYKNNPQKMNEELQALYQRENYSMTAGCLPLLIQMPILFGLIDVIYRPLTHIMHVPAAVITQISEICTANSIATVGYAPEINMLKAIQQAPSMFSALGEEMLNHISTLDLTFMGLDMTLTPKFGFNLLFLIPVISGLTAFLMSWITAKNTPGADGAQGMSMKIMTFTMPLMSVWFTTLVPVGVGIYWIVSNLLGAVQTVVLNKFWNPKEIAEKMKVEEEERKERERKEKIEAKKQAKLSGKANDEKALSQKEINRQKLAEARRRNAEKYGDYGDIEVTDEDLKDSK